MTQPAQAGLNRVKWNLRWDDIGTILLQTIPPEDPHIWEESRFKDKTMRPIFQWGVPARQQGPLVAPGSYSARLTVDGQSVTTPVEVLIDPASPTPQSDLEAMVALQLRVKDDIGRLADKVNLIEQMRHQLETWSAESAGESARRASLQAIDKRLQSVEYEMFSKDLAASDDKFYVSAYKIYFNLIWLNAALAGGALDVAGGFGHGPTAAESQMLDMLEGKLTRVEAQYDELMAKDVARFNDQRQAKGLPTLLTAFTASKADKDKAIPPDDDDEDGDDSADPDRPH
jgi:hypothetical protein